MSNGQHSIGDTRALRILFLENDPDDVRLCLQLLRKEEFIVEADVVTTHQEFCERVCSHHYDVILADYELPAWTGLKALELLRHLGRNIPFIFVSGILDEEIAIQFVKQGAADFILKDRLRRLPLAIDIVLRERGLRENQKLDEMERDQLIAQLRDALADVKRLSSLLPVCLSCNKILDADGQWHRIDLYIQRHPRGQMRPILCPDCLKNRDSDSWDWNQHSRDPDDPDSDQNGGLRV